jgi:hypothetical protein
MTLDTIAAWVCVLLILYVLQLPRQPHKVGHRPLPPRSKPTVRPPVPPSGQARARLEGQ